MNKINKYLTVSNIIFLIVFYAIYMYESTHGMHIQSAFSFLIKAYIIYIGAFVSRYITNIRKSRIDYGAVYKNDIKDAFSDNKKNYKQLLDCLHFYYIEDYNMAKNKFKKLLKVSDKHIDKSIVYYFLGLCTMNSNKDKDEAIEYLENAVKYNPNCADIWAILGFVCMDRRTDKAYYACQQALMCEPNNVIALVEMGQYYYNIGDMNKAIDYSLRAISIDKEYSTKAIKLAALSYAYIGDIQNAYTYREMYKEQKGNCEELSSWVDCLLSF